ncbi:MAG: glycosyltransferase involved in cell wall biosynthesis [Glaciecola sp.]|jgi:glycosyltransferase involved in cell wall biosynthesis
MESNILFLHKCFVTGGGIERVHQNLGSAFFDKSVKHCFYVLNGFGESHSAFTELSNDVTAFRAPESGSFLTKLNNLFCLIKQNRVTSIISATETANLAAFFCKIRFPSLRVVYTRHCAFDVSDQKLSPWAIKLLYSAYLLNGNVVAVSKALKQQIHASVFWGKSKIHFVPNAVISEKMHALANCDSSIEDKGKYFIAVGRLVEQKGFDLLLQAYANALNKNKALPKLVIAGAGEDEQKLKTLAKTLGISEAVNFIGFVSNPYCLIKPASAFILSSRHEGMPTVLVEAMALETPVIAFDCPTGPNELIINGQNGSLVPYLSLEHLKNAMLDYKQLPSVNLSKTVEHFTYSEVANHYLSLSKAPG